jgi:hypothetical protein
VFSYNKYNEIKKCPRQKIYRKHFVRHFRFLNFSLCFKKSQNFELEKSWMLLPNATRIRVNSLSQFNTVNKYQPGSPESLGKSLWKIYCGQRQGTDPDLNF